MKKNFELLRLIFVRIKNRNVNNNKIRNDGLYNRKRPRQITINFRKLVNFTEIYELYIFKVNSCSTGVKHDKGGYYFRLTKRINVFYLTAHTIFLRK